MSDTEAKVKKLAESLGNSLIGRVKRYLKDETDTGFMMEMAKDLAQLQVQAMTASTETERQIAKEDIGFVHARIDSFIARHALKIKNEFEEVVKDILHTAGEVLGILAKAALGTILPA